MSPPSTSNSSDRSLATSFGAPPISSGSLNLSLVRSCSTSSRDTAVSAATCAAPNSTAATSTNLLSHPSTLSRDSSPAFFSPSSLRRLSSMSSASSASSSLSTAVVDGPAPLRSHPKYIGGAESHSHAPAAVEEPQPPTTPKAVVTPQPAAAQLFDEEASEEDARARLSINGNRLSRTLAMAAAYHAQRYPDSDASYDSDAFLSDTSLFQHHPLSPPNPPPANRPQVHQPTPASAQFTVPATPPEAACSLAATPGSATFDGTRSSTNTLRPRNSHASIRSSKARSTKRPAQQSGTATPTAIRHQPSMLDLIDNRKLTTFPQVYNTVIGLSDSIEHESIPVGPSARLMSLFTRHDDDDDDDDGDAHFNRDEVDMYPDILDTSTSIIFVEDYFTKPHADSDSAGTLTTSLTRSSSTKQPASLSPFSTMRKGSLVKTCTHCSKPLYELTGSDFSEFVCTDCAGVRQSQQLHYNTISASSNTASPYGQLHVKKQRRLLRHAESLGDLGAATVAATLPGASFANSSSASLLMSLAARSERSDWYSTVRRKLRWRWRVSGLLPQRS